MAKLREWAEKRVTELASQSQPALELARFVAPAARIEPELLRALRLAVLPGEGPWVEAELWFSSLVRSRSPGGIGLYPEVTALLREQLAALWPDPKQQVRMTLARAVMEKMHENLSPALAIEERVAWHAIAGNLDELNFEIARAVKALTAGNRKGLTAWASQAMDRLPPSSFGTEAGQALRHLVRQRATDNTTPSTTRDSDPALLLADLPTARLGVRRNGGVLELGQLTPRAKKVLPLPDTDPRLVEVIWNENGMERTRRIPVPTGGAEQVAVGIGAVRLRNAWRQEFEVPPFGRWLGPAASWTTLQARAEEEGRVVFSVFNTTSESTEVEFAFTPEQIRQVVELLDGRLRENPLHNLEGDEITAQIMSPEWSRFAQQKPGDVLLLLDSTTAMLPWELLRLSPDDEESALGLAGRLLRQTTVGEREKNIFSEQLPVSELPDFQSLAPTTLVLFATGTSPGPRLAAMRQNTEQVRELLGKAGFNLAAANETSGRDVMSTLYSRPINVLHVCGSVKEVDSFFVTSKASQEQPIDARHSGVDLGDGLLLTPEELRQMPVPPALVVLHASPGEQDIRHQPTILTPAFAAEWGRTLENGGVKAVLVNGWGVEPEPASLFIRAFYTTLLEGSTLAESGLLARRETRRAFPESTAWAAFQVHGEPDYILPSPAAVQATAQETEELLAPLEPTVLLLRQIEKRSVPEPGLYRVEIGERLELKPFSGRLKNDGSPILLLIHGVVSSTRATFGPLWQGENLSMGAEIISRYEGHILAFEYWGLSLSPIMNALTLAESLPVNARLHLLSHSQGGLIAELLCRSARRDGPPFDDRDLAFFADKEREALERLGHILEKKRFFIERFVRVACPARGTDFPQRAHELFGKLSRAVGYVSSLIGKLPLDLVDAAADPERVPGFKASAHSSPLITMLNRPDVTVDTDLSIVAGTFRPDSLSGQLKAKMLHLMISEDNDVLVPTQSMFGGAPRRGPVHFVFFEGPDINHFAYFLRAEIVTTIVNRLLERGVLWRTIATPLPVFLSYSRQDQPAAKELRAALEPLLQQDIVRLMGAEEAFITGDNLKGQLEKGLTEARLVLFLASPSFFASEYAHHEIATTLRRAEQGDCRILPILLSPVDMEKTPLSQWQFIPADGVAIASRKDRESAWQEVVESVRQVARDSQQAPDGIKEVLL